MLLIFHGALQRISFRRLHLVGMESFLTIFEEADPFRTWWPVVFSVLVGLVVVIRNIMSGQRCPSNNQIKQRIVIITGGNRGIGFELAKSLAARGGRIILACRNIPAAERAVSLIKRELNCHTQRTPEMGTSHSATVVEDFQVEAYYLDLSSFDSVRNFAKQIAAAYDHIDVLVNNAGVSFQSENKYTLDGFDLQLQVNYLSHFLLTQLLMPQLKASPHGGRVVNVSAHAHMSAKILDLHDPLNISETAIKQQARDAFAHSKLLVLLVTRFWAQQLQGTNVTVNCFTPGLVRGTGHLKNSLLMSALSVRLMTYPWMWLFMKTPNQGAQCAIYLVTEPELKHVSGEYFNDCEIAECSEQGRDLKLAKNLFAQTVKALAKATKLDIDKECGSSRHSRARPTV